MCIHLLHHLYIPIYLCSSAVTVSLPFNAMFLVCLIDLECGASLSPPVSCPYLRFELNQMSFYYYVFKACYQNETLAHCHLSFLLKFMHMIVDLRLQ